MMAFVSKSALNRVPEVSALLESSWQTIWKEETALLSSLHQSAVEETVSSLSNSKDYWKNAMLQSIDGSGTAYFELESPARICHDRNSLPHLAADGDRLYDIVMLVDLER
jgi:hypothetical protein